MRRFVETVKMELRTFRRNKWNVFAVVVFLMYLLLGYYQYVIMSGYSVNKMLQSSSYITMSAVLAGIVIGVSTAKREKHFKLDELFQTMQGYRTRPFSKLTALMIIAALFTVISYILVGSFYILSKTLVLDFWYMPALYILIYWGMPFFAGGIIGFSLHNLTGSSIWIYPSILLVWISTSPYNIFFPEKLAFILNQAEEELGDTYNEFSGLNVSTDFFLRHLLLIIFALVIFLAVILIFRRYRPGKIGMAASISAAALMAAVCIWIMPRVDHKLSFGIDNIVDFILEDSLFYKQSPNMAPTSKDAGFDVDKYVINMTVNNYGFQYEADMWLKVRKKGYNNLYFTLYHRLDVLDAKINGLDVSWEREGDILHIKPKKIGREAVLHLVVSGKRNHRSYVAPSALYLPPAMAWYPIPGIFRLAEINSVDQVKYKNVSLQTSAVFDIKINSNKNFYSNLKSIAKNHFNSKDTKVFLVCGMLKKQDIGNGWVVGSPELLKKFKNILPHITSKVEEIKNRIGFEAVKVPNKIFFVPVYANITGQSAYEVCGDYLLIDAVTFSIYSQCIDYLSSAELIIPAFFWYDKYHEADGIFPTYFTALYDYVYGTSKNKGGLLKSYIEDRKMASDTYLQMQKLIKDILENYDKRELEILLKAWYRKALAGLTDIDTLKRLLAEIKQ